MRIGRTFMRCRRRGAILSVAVLSGGGGGVVGIDPCFPSSAALAVENTSDARALAILVNCSGGTFDVEWRGSVIVDKTIAVMAGSSLNIVGAGADDAIADGNGTSQLFTVIGNSSLNITRLSFVNGRVSAVDGSVDGGAISANTSFVTLHDTTFLRNYADAASNGGAISALDSQITLSGDTVFEGNIATYGGAIDTSGSLLTWSGNTSFTSNSADEYGGAVHVLEGKLSWTGETYFAHNTAVYGSGGAVMVDIGSGVSWSGNTTFAENIADSFGGAVWIDRASGTWAGNTSFWNNTGSSGGALYLSTTNTSFEGFNSFINNTAQSSGGAIGQHSSNLTWTGDTRFVGNTAQIHAGALLISGTNAQNIWCDGLTEFINNTALQLGGAISDGLFDVSEPGKQLSTLTFVGGSNTVFYRNQAGTNGGALALGSRYSLEFGTDASVANVSFRKNSAETAGGAVYQSGVSRGFTWRNVTFVANYAQIGGAVYSLASGTGTEEIQGRVVELIMTFLDTSFQDNEAATSGGAIESVAGKDTFSNTRFEGNTAALGGALRLAGTSNVIGCEFVQNGATDSAAAVSNAGLILEMVNVSFEENTLLCNSGTFFDYNGEEDFFTDVCQGCPTCTELCVLDGDGSLECVPQYEHTISAGEGVTLETLEIDKGYWRATNTSTLILPCYNTEACVGGITGSPGYCDDGYDGPYCSTCTEGYAKAMLYTCNTCDSKEGLAFAVIVLVVTAILCAMLFAYMVARVDRNNTNNNVSINLAWARLLRLAHDVPFHALKIIIVSWQILTQFDAVANVTYPSVYEDFLDGLSNIIGLEFAAVLSAGCIVDIDFHGRLLFSTLGPLVALGLLGVTYGVAVSRNRHSQEAILRVERKHVSMAILITFLVYSSVSSTVFRMFACERLDDGNYYLRADYNIECDSRRHRALQVYATFMIFLYPVGIPALYAFLLFSNRNAINDGHRRGNTEVSIYVQVTADLWKPYTPGNFYYEVVECARRIALTGIIVFIYPNTAAQVAVTLALAFIFFVVSESLAPYASSADGWMSRVGHIVVFFSMFQALLLKVDVSNERSESQEVFGGVLLAANICMVFAFIVEALIVTRFVWKDNFGDSTIVENSHPMLRRTDESKNRVELVEI